MNKGIKESIYDQLREEGYSPLQAMELTQERYEQFMAELSKVGEMQ